MKVATSSSVSSNRIVAVEVFAQSTETATVRGRDRNHFREFVDRGVDVFDLVGRDFERIGEYVPGDERSVAVENEAAGPLRRNGNGAVAFGALHIRVLIDDLQPGKARDEHREGRQNEAEGDKQATTKGPCLRV